MEEKKQRNNYKAIRWKRKLHIKKLKALYNYHNRLPEKHVIATINFEQM